ncbi:MAG: hypothetical protein M3R70_12925 [Actinomycetota bacterium]|nr:hypothetical protein [Actinomycetota bacterium]
MRCFCLALLVLAVATGCGGETSTTAGGLPLLPRSALPRLAVTTTGVRASQLASDFGRGRGLERRLERWGFIRGRERVFQGQSARIDRVVSRGLEFRRAAGARRYVRYVGAHPATLYGVGSSAGALVSRGRSGFLVDTAACACHRAAPTWLGVVGRGRLVVWLEANGGAVDEAVLRSLLASVPG